MAVAQKSIKTSAGKETASQTVARAKSMLAQTKAEGSKSYKGSSYEKEYNAAIPMTALQPTQVANIPTPPVTPDYGAVAKPEMVTPTTIEQGFQNNQDWLNTALQGAYNEVGTGESRLAKLEKDNQLKQKEQAVNSATESLNQIVAKQQQDLISTRGTASANGVTEAVYGGIQNEINRNAALQALPVQAQLAAAQNNLELAQSHIEKMYAIQSQDAQAKYQYKTKVIESLYNFANEQQQRQLDQLNIQESRKYDEKKTNIAYQRDLAGQATQSGQSSLAGSIMRLDPNSPTYQNDLANLGGQVVDTTSALQRESLRAQIISSNRANQPQPAVSPWELKDVNGKSMWVNKDTQETKPVSGDSGINSLESAKDVESIKTITGLTTHRGLSKAVGTNALARWTPFKADTTTGDVSDFIATVDQLTKDLTVDNLATAKDRGVTFGALSEAELSLIADSATKINNWRRTNETGNTTHYETSEKNMTKELDTINNYKKLDAVLKGIPPASVGIVVMPDGTYWTTNSDGSFTEIN